MTAVVTQIRLRAHRLVHWMRQQWRDDTSSMGFTVGHHEVDRILGGTATTTHRDAFFANHPEAAALAEPIAVADRAVEADPRMRAVVDKLGLAAAEQQLLALAVALELDPWLRRVVGYLHDDATAMHATQWLADQLFAGTGSAALAAGSRLVGWRLAAPIEGHPLRWSALGPWLADPAVVTWLATGSAIDPALGDAIAIATSCPSTPLYPHALDAMYEHASPLRGRATEIALVGAPGAGKRTLAAQLCDRLGVPLLVADLARCKIADAAVRTVRSARLLDAAVYWHDAGEVAAGTWSTIEPQPLLSIVATTADVRVLDESAVRRTVTLLPPSASDRMALWSRLAPAHPVPEPVRSFSLMPADIVRAAALAGASVDAITAACRATLPADAAALATPLVRYEEDELVVTEALQEHLDELVAQARLRAEVLENRRFGRLAGLRGLTALFAGPSGTGKTMAARIIARKLGMDLYRVDLAGVVSKYIGETEKHLRRLFDACERANIILFFDEADALFGKRTQVKDAHDRFANIEVDYLLQRMETFEGMSILATNRRHDLDTAFVRRMRFIVEFAAPTIEDRKRMWISALAEPDPAKPQVGELDFDVLARRLELTGADIKSAALGAAFLACNEGSLITMTHVVRAAGRELAKRGVVARAEDMIA